LVESSSHNIKFRSRDGAHLESMLYLFIHEYMDTYIEPGNPWIVQRYQVACYNEC